MTAHRIDGTAVAAAHREATARQVAEFVSRTGRQPGLSAVLVGDDPASAVYVRSKQRACEQAGMRSALHRLPAAATTAELLAVIDRLNADPGVNGILVQLPLPPGIPVQTVLDRVAPEKDVDCFHPANVGRLVQGRPWFLPCTPQGVLVLLDHAGIDTAGAHVVVLGRSEIVGKPLAAMLMQKGQGGDATVTVCHSRTRNLAAITRSADIVVAAIGRAEFVRASMIRPGAVVIDVGINRVDGKLVGDVAFDEVAAVAGAITPVPGGVGPMTIACLLRNTLAAARRQAEPAE